MPKSVNSVSGVVQVTGAQENDPIERIKGKGNKTVPIKAPISRIGVKGLGKEQLSPEARRSFSEIRASDGMGGK